MGGQTGWRLACHLRRDAIKRPLRGPRERQGALRRVRPEGPKVYVINVELNRMIVEADQAAGIIMEAADEEEEEEK